MPSGNLVVGCIMRNQGIASRGYILILLSAGQSKIWFHLKKKWQANNFTTSFVLYTTKLTKNCIIFLTSHYSKADIFLMLQVLFIWTAGGFDWQGFYLV